MIADEKEDRFIGCLLGLMAGDSLGSHFEGMSPGRIARHYPSRDRLMAEPPPGMWRYTDDTQMMIGVAETLLEDGRIEEAALAAKFAENYEPYRGYGGGARQILEAIRQGRDYRDLTENLLPGGSFGNGAAMRVAPVGLRFCHDLNRVWEEARASAWPTHVHPLGVEGAQLLALAVALAVRSDTDAPEQIHDTLKRWAHAAEYRGRLAELPLKSDERIRVVLGNGIAAHESVVTAFACFLRFPDSFSDVIAAAILLGGDTDTIAAMAGAISGARLGVSSIPARFLEPLEEHGKGKSYVIDLAGRLFAESEVS